MMPRKFLRFALRTPFYGCIFSAIPAWQSSSTGSSVTNGTFVCAIVNDGERNPDLSTTTPLPKFCQAGIAGIF